MKKKDNQQKESQQKESQQKERQPKVNQGEGRWVTAACWHNCGGRCMNKVLIKDGAVVRQKTDDTHPDSFDYPQQRGCVRGRAQQQQCFGEDRLKYPMKRVHWSPENANGGLRGRDTWERISWEEAFSYVAGEYTKIRDRYGMEAFLVCGEDSRYRCPSLAFLGGHTSTTDSTSWGSFLLNTTMLGLPKNNRGMGNDRMDLVNADIIVLYAANPAWSAPGTPAYHLIRAKEAGVRFLTVGPDYSATAQTLDADWIPVRTGTDTALLLGVAYEMLRLDAEEHLVDWEFLQNYTVGFDGESLPKDARISENFRDYVLGRYDGTPKDAAWASRICGTPEDTIIEFARSLGKQNKVTILHNYGMARNNGAENFPQLLMTVAAMGGHFGKSGHAMTANFHANAGNSGPRLVKPGETGIEEQYNPIEAIIPGPQVWDACITGKYRYCGDFYNEGYAPGKDCTCDIHCIVHETSAYLQTGPNMKRGIEAHRKMDFVVTRAQFMTTCTKYSDIVLPVCTRWEVPGGVMASNREFILCYSKVVEPRFESKTDQEIDKGILEAMGYDPLELYPISEEQQFMNQIAGSTYLDENGDYVPLVTVTAEELSERGMMGTPQKGIISLTDFVEQGGYQVERKEADNYRFIGYEDFIKDPEKHPLPSKSGKFEIYCQEKADALNAFGFSKRTYKPYPEYITPELGYETTFVDGKLDGNKGEYPYLLYNPHYLRRSHTVFDNCTWLKEAWKNPVFLNEKDAKEKQIQNGDRVLVWTKYGSVLRQACVMETLMPGIVGLPHGAWSDYDEKTRIDRGGSDNMLTGNDIYGMGVTGYNNCNCNFTKYEGDAENVLF